MATLAEKTGGQRFDLPARCLIGRSHACALRLEAAHVSSEHARIAWETDAWTLRDLGSRNGTFVGDRRLKTGEAQVLETGDEIGFGATRPLWVVADVKEPVAMARDPNGGELRAAEDGLLALPSPDDPQILVFDNEAGRWVAETEGELSIVADGMILHAGDRPWVLHLPDTTEPTLISARRGPAIETIHLAFAVSRDEEHVELNIEHETVGTRLNWRAHHYLLLTLARARIEDIARGDLSANEEGWRYADELCRDLAINDLRLNTDIYRARKELAAAGIAGAVGIVERRRSTRQIRLGTDRTTVTRL